MSRFRFIAAENANYSVVRADGALTDQIRDVHTNSHCTYGAPRIHAELRATGTRVGKKRVARLIRSAGLAGRCPKRFRRTTIPAVKPAAQPPDLVRRDFHSTGPDRLWLSDITYVRTSEGWLYLAIILDAFSSAPRGAVIPRGLRDPPLAAAAAGRS